jgi:hypothetical protein
LGVTQKIKGASLGYYALIGFVWAFIAIVLVYLLLVRVFQPADGYYKLDVYLCYILTLALPIAVGWWKKKKASCVTGVAMFVKYVPFSPKYFS